MGMAMKSGRTLTVLVPAPRLLTGFAPIWLVKILGYDQTEGLTVRFDLAASGSPTSAAAGVVAGRGDMTFVNIVFALLALHRNVPLLPFYAYVRKQNRSFAVPDDSPIRTLDDLKGRTIGLHFDDPELTAFARAVLAEAGLDVGRDVTLVPLPGGPLDVARMARALREGVVDAVWQLDIFTGLMAAEGLALRHLPASIDRLSPSSTLMATRQALVEQSEMFGALGRAVAKATVFAMNDPEAAIRLVWRAFPESAPAPDKVEQALRQELAALKVRLAGQSVDDQRAPAWGKITETEIEAWLSFLRRSGAISSCLAARDCFHDALVPAFNDFDMEAVRAEARRAAAASVEGGAAKPPDPRD